MPVIGALLVFLVVAAPVAGQPGNLIEVHVDLQWMPLLLDRQPSPQEWKQAAEKTLAEEWAKELSQTESLSYWQFVSPEDPKVETNWKLTASVREGGPNQAFLWVSLVSVDPQRGAREVVLCQNELWSPMQVGAKSVSTIRMLERELTARLGCLMGYSPCEVEHFGPSWKSREDGRLIRHENLLEHLTTVPVARQVDWMTDIQVDPPNLLVPLRRVTASSSVSFRLDGGGEPDYGDLIVDSLGSHRRHQTLGEALITAPTSLLQGSRCYEVKAASLVTALGEVDLRELVWQWVYLYKYPSPGQRLLRATRPCESRRSP